MLIWLLRGCFAVLLLGICGGAMYLTILQNQPLKGVLMVVAVLVIGGTVMFADLWERNKQITTLSVVAV